MNSEIVKLFNDGSSIGEISKIFNCNPETIRLRLRKNVILNVFIVVGNPHLNMVKIKMVSKIIFV